MTTNSTESNTTTNVTSNATTDATTAATTDATTNALSGAGQSALSLPDRLAVDPRSPHYNEAVLSRDIGIRFKGAERHDVEEYCVSEGWIKVASGRARDRRGNPILIKLLGPVEPFFK